jgi:hypothetical protein
MRFSRRAEGHNCVVLPSEIDDAGELRWSWGRKIVVIRIRCQINEIATIFDNTRLIAAVLSFDGPGSLDALRLRIGRVQACASN